MHSSPKLSQALLPLKGNTRSEGGVNEASKRAYHGGHAQNLIFLYIIIYLYMNLILFNLVIYFVYLFIFQPHTDRRSLSLQRMRRWRYFVGICRCTKTTLGQSRSELYTQTESYTFLMEAHYCIDYLGRQETAMVQSRNCIADFTVPHYGMATVVFDGSQDRAFNQRQYSNNDVGRTHTQL